MEILNLTVESRIESGKGASRKLRREEQVPGVLYGPKMKVSAGLFVSAKALGKTVRNTSGSLIKLNAEGVKDLDGKMVLVKASQRHPVTKDYLHVDFYEVDLTKSIKIRVPMKYVGKSLGVTEGGILDIIRREIEVQCLPNQIPQAIDVDVTELNIGDNFHVQDLKMPEGVTPTGDVNYTVVSISSPDEEEEIERPQALADEEGSAEVPRVGEEEKKDGEEEAPADDKKKEKKEKKEN